MKSFQPILSAILVITALASQAFGPQAFAMEQIIRPYQSVRGAGMGGVKITTGLYDENFWGNPARVMANPRFRFTLLDPAFEVNGTSINTVGDIVGSGDTLQKIGNTAGKNNHGRFQLTVPSIYIPVSESGKMAFAFGIVNSAQFDVNLRQSYQINPQAYLDSAAVFTIGRKFLKDDALVVGVNTKYAVRVNMKDTYTMAELLRNSTMGFSEIGGAGGMLNFDLGGTYTLPMMWNEFSFQGGLVLNNLLGGKYSKLGDSGGNALDNPRTLGFGMSARRPSVWKFTDFVVALEMTDINNSGGGSFWRLIHVGSEARYGILAPRLGLNQGYWTIGCGVLTRLLTFEYAYYGEEMTLNPGGYQDYRHAIKIALQI